VITRSISLTSSCLVARIHISHGVLTPKASATLIAETTHPSSNTIPSHIQPPTIQTPPSPFFQADAFSFSEYSSNPRSSKILLMMSRLSGVRRTRVNAEVWIILVLLMGVIGQVVTEHQMVARELILSVPHTWRCGGILTVSRLYSP